MSRTDRGFNPVYRGSPQRSTTVRVVSYLLVMLVTIGMIVTLALRADAHHERIRVHRGDTLAQLADEHGTPGGWKRLAGRNRLRDPDWITVGQVLIVPHRDQAPRYPNYPRASRTRSAMGGDRSRMANRYNDLNWRALARCESGMRGSIHNPSGAYHGFFQFDLQTWHSVGMSGDPHNYGWDTQLEGAKRLYASRGRSPWPHCGSRL